MKIHSISADPIYKDSVKKASIWLANSIKVAGCENIEIIPTKVLLKKGSNGFTSKCIKLSNKIWLYAPTNAPVKDETTLISDSVLSHFNFAKLFSFCKLLFQNLRTLSQIGIPIIAQDKAIIDDPINVWKNLCEASPTVKI